MELICGCLRKMELSDADFVLEIRNDITTRMFLHNSTEYSQYSFAWWFQANEPCWFIIYDPITLSKPVGYVRTTKISEDELQIGMDIHPDHRGKGIATTVYERLFEFFFQEYKIISLEVLDHNTIAHKMYLKLGFQEVSRKPYDNNCGSRESIKMIKNEQ